MIADVRAIVASLLRPVRDRLALRRAIRSGPPYRPSHQSIVIDITTACDLGCTDCDRSCSAGQAPSAEHLALAQVEQFVRESIDARRTWRTITLEGGEPTLHPRLVEIVGLLGDYRQAHSPRTGILIVTNGYRSETRSLANQVRRRGVQVVDTRKRSRVQAAHRPFNVAPRDVPTLAGADFTQGCHLPACHGLGLTRHGYYPHPVCGGIDRVFGFNIGRMTLPSRDDTMRDLFGALCPLCGMFTASIEARTARRTTAARLDEYARISPSWCHAYARFHDDPPRLAVYGGSRT